MEKPSIQSEVHEAAKRLLHSEAISNDIFLKVLKDKDAIKIESPGDTRKKYPEYEQERDYLVNEIARLLTGMNPDAFALKESQREWGIVHGQMLKHPQLGETAQLNGDKDPHSNVLGTVEDVLNQELAKATCLVWDLSEAMGITGAKKDSEDNSDLEQLGDVDQKMRQVYDAVLF